MQQMVLPNAPSIPSHQNVFGYEENQRGELIKQKNQEKVLTGVGIDTAGPGHYEPAQNTIGKRLEKQKQTAQWK